MDFDPTVLVSQRDGTTTTTPAPAAGTPPTPDPVTFTGTPRAADIVERDLASTADELRAYLRKLDDRPQNEVVESFKEHIKGRIADLEARQAAE